MLIIKEFYSLYFAESAHKIFNYLINILSSLSKLECIDYPHYSSSMVA